MFGWQIHNHKLLEFTKHAKNVEKVILSLHHYIQSADWQVQSACYLNKTKFPSFYIPARVCQHVKYLHFQIFKLRLQDIDPNILHVITNMCLTVFIM